MLNNKVVVVTGASSGIGAEIALAFAINGANLVLTYKSNKKGAQEVKKRTEKQGVKVVIVKADLCNDGDASKTINMALKRFGRLDVLVNNAGRYIGGDEWDGKAEIWMKSLQQNLVSVMSMSKYAIKVFKKQRNGVIVNIASRYAANGQFDALAYAAAKSGVVNITQAYAKLLAPYGRANSVSPGAVNVGYWKKAPKKEIEETLASIPLGRFIEPGEIAEAVVFLASEKARNITGQNISIEGGYNLK